MTDQKSKQSMNQIKQKKLTNNYALYQFESLT